MTLTGRRSDITAAPERIVPAETPSGPLSSHLKRYEFALPYCKGLRVLDAACGVGYGSAYLATEAAHVVGIDVAPEAVAYARSNYGKPNVRFLVGDAHRLPVRDKSFDVLVSFETIEHLPDPAAFLMEAERLLTPSGRMVLSTPHVKRTRRNPPENPYHVIEYSRSDLEVLLAQHFERVDVFGQRRRQSELHWWLQRADPWKLRTKIPRRILAPAARATGTIPWQEADLSQFEINHTRIERATEIVAVCDGVRRWRSS